ncbi:DUF6285 domain-containing protein [Phenylobacterium sp.]|uniref:DUF6285 domain-containing protein n=1 Tax=Phenylobacterium sp. TaxID=1871053 RepID=UPI003BA94652
MITHPRTEELVDAVARWIDSIRPELKPRDAFLARVAVNVLGVVKREVTLGPAAEAEAVARMAALLGHTGGFEALTAELCEQLRTGGMDAATPGLLAALRANAQDRWP